MALDRHREPYGAFTPRSVLSAPTNFDDALLGAYAELGVAEVYGAPRSLGGLGQGRPGVALPDLDLDHLLGHISLAAQLGLGFTLVLNPGCSGNIEFWPERIGHLRTVIERSAAAGATTVTVSNPALMRIVREVFPEALIKVSVFAQVSSLTGLDWWLSEGADIVTLPPRKNRDFRFLRRIPEAHLDHVELLANNLCLPRCPLEVYHSQVMAHSDNVPADFLDPCLSVCNRRLHDLPHLIIASPWIRPEDLLAYEGLGIHRFKLADRSKPTEWLVNAARAYATGRSPDDLATILNAPELPSWPAPTEFSLGIRSDMLDGLLDYFEQELCDGDCESAAGCVYCKSYARRAVATSAAICAS